MRFRFEGEGGNTFYLDDINLYEGSPSDEIIVGLNEVAQDIQMKVYPNPTDDKLTVSIRQGVKIKDLNFVDFSGKILKPRSIIRNQDNIDINVSNLNEGIYILEIVSDKEVDKVKVVIER